MPTVLVTGASRGIGRSITEYLAQRGWDVVAGVRTPDDAAAVAAADTRRITPVILDVTDDGHIADLARSLPARLDGIVNNAGIAVNGPMEAVTTADWRKQLEVNVIGQLAVTRAVLPKLRESTGRVVFMSSVNGRMSMPMLGAYSASKYALEAAADAMRMELRPWRIPVVIIEPAQTDTDMWRSAGEVVLETEAAMEPHHRALYAKHLAGMKKLIPIAQRMAVPTDEVSAVVERALTTRRPRARYVVGFGPKAQVRLMTNLPTAVRDLTLRKVTGQP
ncbi:SDR family NAD(P)-dependent oxidoreductase [Mycolicibacterium sp.]|uniref:SDR family NAD(P)-dependent oxidoreductase n=1 Tax=Mycolicibacterium sp. TaxID=2320850 RepID=UPI001A1C8333|nr:SDR family NAD(P)-dependent oxidoreductase [Mycolicibacterium sp.]MBJ7339382.1 SDR family NAD(P)-dependent oxidoreductase [Mycolicibacterium sp.]